MVTLSNWLTGAHVAGIVAVLIGVVDAWAFHGTFTIDVDKALVLAGLVWLGGVTTGTGLTAAVRKTA